MTSTPPPQPAAYAWCFSHGRIHTFRGDPWCTAFWAPLPGDTEPEALRHKIRRYGDARFIHHLPDEMQLVVMDFTRAAVSSYGKDPTNE